MKTNLHSKAVYRRIIIRFWMNRHANDKTITSSMSSGHSSAWDALVKIKLGWLQSFFKAPMQTRCVAPSLLRQDRNSFPCSIWLYKLSCKAEGLQKRTTSPMENFPSALVYCIYYTNTYLKIDKTNPLK